MSRAYEVRALAACVRDCAAAKDGRGRRPPIRTTALALFSLGASDPVAMQCAVAAGAIGAHLRGLIVAAGFKP